MRSARNVLVGALICFASTPASAAAATFVGHVLLPSGAPAAGVEVRAYAPAQPGSTPPCTEKRLVSILVHECPPAPAGTIEQLESNSWAAKALVSTRADAEGRFKVEVPVSLADLAFAAQGSGFAILLDAKAGDLGEVRLSKAAAVRVSVEGQAEAPPRGGVMVWVVSERPRLAWMARRVAGAFVAEDVPMGLPLKAILDARGFKAAQSAFTPPEQTTLFLSRETSIRGIVTRDGVPFPGATVRLKRLPYEEQEVPAPALVLSDTRGEFVIEGAERMSEVEAFANTLAGADEGFEGDMLEIRLRPAHTLTVDVLDASSGKPIVGADLWGGSGQESLGRDGSQSSGTLPAMHFTEVQPGRFVATHLVRGAHVVIVKAPGYAESTGMNVYMNDKDEQVAFRLSLTPTTVQPGANLRTISGVVRNDKTGAPVAGAKLALSSRESVTRIKGDSDEHGAFAYTTSLQKPEIEIQAEGYRPARIEVPAEQKGPLVLRLSPLPTGGLDVTVVHEDGTPAPAAGAMLQWKRARGWQEVHWVSHEEPDGNGRLHLPSLDAGEYKLTAFERGYVEVETSLSIAEIFVPLTVMLKPAQVRKDLLPTAGVIVNEVGEPYPHCQLVIADELIESDDTGHFTLPPLPPGNYSVALAAGPNTIMAWPDAPDVRAGDQQVRLVRPRPPVIRGRVIGSDGPLHRFSIGRDVIETATGEFRYENYPGGWVTLFAHGYISREGRFELKPGQVFDLGDVVLPRRSYVVGNVTRDGKPVVYPRMTLSPSPPDGRSPANTFPLHRDRPWANGGGQFELHELPPGHYTLAASADGWISDPVPFDVVEGKDLALQIALTKREQKAPGKPAPNKRKTQ